MRKAHQAPSYVPMKAMDEEIRRPYHIDPVMCVYTYPPRMWNYGMGNIMMQQTMYSAVSTKAAFQGFSFIQSMKSCQSLIMASVSQK